MSRHHDDRYQSHLGSFQVKPVITCQFIVAAPYCGVLIIKLKKIRVERNSPMSVPKTPGIDVISRGLWKEIETELRVEADKLNSQMRQ